MSDEFLEYRDVEESQSGSSIPQSSAPTTLILQKEISKNNNEKAENSDDEKSIEIIITNILKNINEVQICWNSKYNS
ncbi:11447_t:CDS:2 [Funneliformis geosporum]|nr:11447_t:CDS:2 [Funneliformis geosporum]